MEKKVKKAIADVNKRLEQLRDEAIVRSAQGVKLLRRELDRLARRLDAMVKHPAA